MTKFGDIGGLTGIKALKIDGASKWIGQSAVVAGIDATDLSAMTFSLTNYSSTGYVFDCGTTSAELAAEGVKQIIQALAKAGIATASYNGTNKIS